MAKIDPKTNLPELPKGYVWHVNLNAHNWVGKYISVGIWDESTKVPRIFVVLFNWIFEFEHFVASADRRVDRDHDPVEDFPGIIRDLADRALEKWGERAKQITYEREFALAANELGGFYPPKKLTLDKP